MNMIEFNLSAICERQRRLDYNKEHDRKGRFTYGSNTILHSGREATAILKSKIKSGEISTKLRWTDQNKHTKGTEKYQNAVKKGEYPSYTLNTNEELQEIIDRCSGPIYIREKDIIRHGSDPEFKGMSVNRNTGKAVRTTKYTIHYSKYGTHIVPRRP